MPRLTLIAVLSVLVCGLLCPTIAAADSSGALIERYIASTFRAMADTAMEAPSKDDAAAALSTIVRSEMAVDATARYVLGSDWPTENPRAASKFRQQFLDFVSNALASALRGHRAVILRVMHSRYSNGRYVVDSTIKLDPRGVAFPLTWIVRPEGPKGRRRIEDFVLAGIDAQMMLREMVSTTLEQHPGNLDAVAAMLDRLAARAGAPNTAAAE